jgi:hypothetical protein
MADQKTTQFTAMTNPAAPDLLMIINDPNGTPANQKITLKNLFGGVPANTVFEQRVTAQANLTVTGKTANLTSNLNVTGISTLSQLKVANDHLIINTRQTPGSNSATGAQGEFAYDTDYVYVAVANNIWKRATLSSF